MHVTCPKCRLTIEVEVQTRTIGTIAWGMNDPGIITATCPIFAELPEPKPRPEDFNCKSLVNAVSEAINPTRI